MQLSDDLKYYLLQLLSNQTYPATQATLAGEVNDFITYLQTEQQNIALANQAAIQSPDTTNDSMLGVSTSDPDVPVTA